MKAFTVNQLQPRSAVGLPLPDGTFQRLHIFLGAAYQHFPAADEFKIQFLCKLSHVFIPLHTEPGLKGPGVIGKPSVDHAGIASAGLITYVQIFLQHTDFQGVSGHFPGNGTAYHAAADNEYII